MHHENVISIKKPIWQATKFKGNYVKSRKQKHELKSFVKINIDQISSIPGSGVECSLAVLW